jgi:DNA repair protein RadC
MHVVSTGSIDQTPVHPREVFSPAIRDGAVAVVVAHNHPSGEASPSAEDRLVTERLRDVGRLVGIDLLDHLVVGAERYYSFADEAFFPFA